MDNKAAIERTKNLFNQCVEKLNTMDPKSSEYSDTLNSMERLAKIWEDLEKQEAAADKAKNEQANEQARIDIEQDKLDQRDDEIDLEHEKLKSANFIAKLDLTGKVIVGVLTGVGAAAGTLGAAAIAAKAKGYAVDKTLEYEDGKRERTNPQKVTSSAQKLW